MSLKCDYLSDENKRSTNRNGRSIHSNVEAPA